MLPVDNPTKPQAQTILHAIEELYFFKRYIEARKLAEDTLKGKLNQDYRETVLDCKTRCEAKLLIVQERKKDWIMIGVLVEGFRHCIQSKIVKSSMILE